MTIKINNLTGDEAEKAAAALRREIAAQKREITKRGGSTFEAVVLLPDGGLTSAVTGDGDD